MKKINLKKPTRNQVIRICNLLSVPLQFLGCCVLYLVIEALSRHSLWEAWQYMTGSPLIFLYNAFLIFTTSLVVYLFKHRILARTIVGCFWFLLGCVNGFLLLNRVTPFTGPDLKLINDAMRILNKYLSPGLVVAVLVGLGVLLLFFIWMFRKGWKFQGKMRYWLNIPLIVAGVAIFALTSKLAIDNRLLSTYFGNIAYAYQDYGYPYCLAVTIFDTGINEPNGYSKALMEDIVNSEGEIKETKKKNTDVNILFLQLETFIDPTEVNFLSFSEDPIPNFRKLSEEYSSGYYKVPAVGAGTANTEFESITGMSLHYFGAGEYPYKTILKETTCESAAYDLKKLGYSTHAIHNNEANFYGRRTVFSRLGFDTFTSEEYMPDISDTTPMGWVKDHILTDEIFKAMESTEGPDYVYTISVQGHGDYPTEPVLSDPEIKVTGAESEEKNNAWEYYVIVSNVAGTTRDAIDTNVMWNGKEYVFIDTAGLRRKNKIKEELERYSIIRTVTAVERADVVIVVIDAVEGITEQDAKIAGIAHERGKGVIIAVNKWDAVEKDDKTIYKYTNKVREVLAYMPYAEILFISAQTGQRLPKLFETIDMVLENQTLRIQTGVLNEIMTEAIAMQQPPSDKGKRLKLYYMTQVSIKPPTFVIFVNDKELMHFSYTRYLENKIREAFGFRGTSLKFIIRERNGEK